MTYQSPLQRQPAERYDGGQRRLESDLPGYVTSSAMLGQQIRGPKQQPIRRFGGMWIATGLLVTVLLGETSYLSFQFGIQRVEIQSLLVEPARSVKLSHLLV